MFDLSSTFISVIVEAAASLMSALLVVMALGVSLLRLRNREKAAQRYEVKTLFLSLTVGTQIISSSALLLVQAGERVVIGRLLAQMASIFTSTVFFAVFTCLVTLLSAVLIYYSRLQRKTD